MEHHESLDTSADEIDPINVLEHLSQKQRGDIQRAVMKEMKGEMEGGDEIEKLTAWAKRYGDLFDKALLKYSSQENIPLEDLVPIEKHPGEITAITENLHFLIEHGDDTPPVLH